MKQEKKITFHISKRNEGQFCGFESQFILNSNRFVSYIAHFSVIVEFFHTAIALFHLCHGKINVNFGVSP